MALGQHNISLCGGLGPHFGGPGPQFGAYGHILGAFGPHNWAKNRAKGPHTDRDNAC